MSKRLKLYFGELGQEKPRILPELTVQHMREADQLIRGNQAANTHVAIRMVLGKHVEAAPPLSVQRIELALRELIEGQAALTQKIEQLLVRCAGQPDQPSGTEASRSAPSDEIDSAFDRLQAGDSTR